MYGLDSLRSWPLLAAVILGYSSIGTFSHAQEPTRAEVRVIISSEDGKSRLSEFVPIPLVQGEGKSEIRIEIYPDQTRQTILGLGASLEHATCENLSKLSQEQRDEVVEKLVDPSKGIGMNLMRVCIGTSDYFMMGQFMKYIEPDAVCVDSTNPGGPIFRNVAFINPDGTKVLVVSNASRETQTFSVQIGPRSSSTYLPPASVRISFGMSGEIHYIRHT